MADSASIINTRQDRWASNRARDPRWPQYLPRVDDNLFLRRLHASTVREFDEGDGTECSDKRDRPAKMRALVSSSALAVNFFDAWRDADKLVLGRALDLPGRITSLQFEFKTRNYPVKPRSPNLDLLLCLDDGRRIGVESKFSEPYRTRDGYGGMSARYFQPETLVWKAAGLEHAQQVADRFRPQWIHLDVPQLLKHLLGLASDPGRPSTLLYLWYDTGAADASVHRHEIDTFRELVAKDRVAVVAATYQEAFARIDHFDQPVPEWYDYMALRYFAPHLW